MDKTYKKILRTILEVLAFFIGQHFVRKHFGIDPRIWFIVVYGISAVWFIFIIWDFWHEKEEGKCSLCGFLEWFIKETQGLAKRIANSFPYLIISITTLFTVLGIMLYKCFFYEDFKSRTNIYIVFLVMIAYLILATLLDFIASEEKKKKNSKIITVLLWISIFIVNLSDFLK